MACPLCDKDAAKVEIEVGRQAKTKQATVRTDPFDSTQFTTVEIADGYEVKLADSCSNCGYWYRSWTEHKSN